MSSAGRPQQPYHHGDLPRALLEQALIHLRRVGPDQLSLRALARDVGVSQTAPYRHFADKMELLAALAALGFDRLWTATSQAAAGQTDAREALLASGLAYVHFARENPELYKLMFGPVLGVPGQYPQLRAAGGRAFQVIVDIVEQGMREGRFKAVDRLLVANTAWALVHGLASLLIDGLYHGTGEELEARLRQSLELCLSGFEISR